MPKGIILKVVGGLFYVKDNDKIIKTDLSRRPNTQLFVVGSNKETRFFIVQSTRKAGFLR